MDLKIPPEEDETKKGERRRKQRSERRKQDRRRGDETKTRRKEGRRVSPLSIDLGVHHFTLDVGDTKVLSNLSGQGLELSRACNNQRGGAK